MHREYHPEDLRRGHAHVLGGHHHEHGEHHPHDDHGPLFLLTVLLALLLGADLVFGALSLEAWRKPLFGVSLVWLAAVLGGARIVYGALSALVQGRLGADFALAQACVAAVVLGEPFVAAEVVFIALVGEALEAITADRAFRAIGRLFDQSPRVARVRRDGLEQEVLAEAVEVGDLVIIGAGERVPIDGLVLEGRSTLDMSSLTGESLPVDAGPGDRVAAGTINQYGRIEVQAEKVGKDTTLARVLRLVAEAQLRKAPLQRTADRLAGYFLPIVQTVAVGTLLVGLWLGWPDVWSRAVAILVVACPCALVLATPAAILASLAWTARHGVIVKGGAALERLAKCDTFAFDKTGTLTLGRPEPGDLRTLGTWGPEDLLRLAAGAEASSRHPLAEVVRQAAEARGLEAAPARDVEALPGAGVAATCSLGDREVTVLVGNRRLMRERGLTIGEPADQALAELDGQGQTALLIAVDGSVAGLIGARDRVRPEAHDVIHELKHLKFGELAILTGDRVGAARAVAKRVHIKNVEAELAPADKARWVEERLAAGRRVAMVGDGINDAPALARATVGLAIGGVGADLAAEAGDIVLMGGPLAVLPDLVRLSRATVHVIHQNILGFAFGLNAVAMGAAALGWLGPVPAAVLHQVGSLLVLLNAMRLLAFGDWHNLGPIRGLRALGRAIASWDDRFDHDLLVAWLVRRHRPLLGTLGTLAVAVYMLSGAVAIGPAEVGLVIRQGRLAANLGPGLHLRWPPPFETTLRVAPGRVQGLALGFRDVPLAAGTVRWGAAHDRATVARVEDESLLMTGDGQLVELAATVQYRIDSKRVRSHILDTADAEGAARSIAESTIREEVSRRTLDQLLTNGRTAIERAVGVDLQRRFEAMGLGLIVETVAFQDVHPPLAVVEAYRDVSLAEGEKRTRLNQANTKRAERLAEARGLAFAKISRAEADRFGDVERARGRADAFLSIRDARGNQPELTELRLYQEMLAASLTGRNKVLIDPAQAGRRHLFLMGTPPFPLDPGERGPNAPATTDAKREAPK